MRDMSNTQKAQEHKYRIVVQLFICVFFEVKTCTTQHTKELKRMKLPIKIVK